MLERNQAQQAWQKAATAVLMLAMPDDPPTMTGDPPTMNDDACLPERPAWAVETCRRLASWALPTVLPTIDRRCCRGSQP